MFFACPSVCVCVLVKAGLLVVIFVALRFLTHFVQISTLLSQADEAAKNPPPSPEEISALKAKASENGSKVQRCLHVQMRTCMRRHTRARACAEARTLTRAHKHIHRCAISCVQTCVRSSCVCSRAFTTDLGSIYHYADRHISSTDGALMSRSLILRRLPRRETMRQRQKQRLL